MSLPKRTLVIGDIHGGLKALQQVWNRANISKQDTLFFWEIMWTVGVTPWK